MYRLGGSEGGTSLCGNQFVREKDKSVRRLFVCGFRIDDYTECNVNAFVCVNEQ